MTTATLAKPVPTIRLFFRRTKLFLGSIDGAEVRYQGAPSGTGKPDHRVPVWVRGTLTYKHGIADGSIIDLSPAAAQATGLEADVSQGYANQPAIGKDASIIPDAVDEDDEDEDEADAKPAGGSAMPQGFTDNTKNGTAGASTPTTRRAKK
jgi:hypothetical protein